MEIAEIQISYTPNEGERPKICGSRSAYEILIERWDKSLLPLLEEFKVILMNNAGQVLGIVSLSKGGMTGTVVDIRLLFAVALKATATALIVAHNHPSGNLRPSEQDINLTKKIKEGGMLLDIKIHDHLIVTEFGYYSFQDEGMMLK